MTNEEGRVAFMELLRAYNAEEDDIVSKAKQEGRWRSGLDSNQDLFVELKDKYKRLHAELVEKINNN